MSPTNHWRLPFAALFLFVAFSLRGELQFVGMISSQQGDHFAVRPEKDARAEWIRKGGTVAGYSVEDYDSRSETLTLKKGASLLKLQLPTARIKPLEKNEIIAGLGAALNQPQAKTFGDFIHPMLRHLVKDANAAGGEAFAAIVKPDVKMTLRELPKEFAQHLDSTLTAAEKAIGQRPTHGLWVQDGSHLTITIVSQVEGRWYLLPNLPEPVIEKLQPAPPVK